MEISFILKVLHLLGFAIGIGGATASDALFFRSLKDKEISFDELNLLKTLSKLMWFGLGLLILSGAGFLILSKLSIGAVPLFSDARFLSKMTIVGIIFLNGLAFHIFVMPYLSKHTGHTISHEFLGSKLYLLVATGGISIASWYSAFFFALLRGVNFSYMMWMNFYILAVFLAILGGYIFFSRQLKFTLKSQEDSGTPKLFSKAIIVFIVIVVAVILYIAFNPKQSPSKTGITHTVCINEVPPWFRPDVLRIKRGDTVMWSHCEEDHTAHNNLEDMGGISIFRHVEVSAHEEDEKDTMVHTHPILAVAGPEIFSSKFRPVGHVDEGNGFSFSFTKEGVYEYLCPTHPYMKGIIVVDSQYDKDSLWPPMENIKPSLLPPPKIPGIGEIWLDTQFEKVEGRKYPGTITVIDANTWQIKKKIGNDDFNNPHNLWNTSGGEYVFQTQWHSNKISKIDIKTKEVIKSVVLGNAPAHVHVHPKKEKVYVTLNNEKRVMILNYDLEILGEIETSFGPHGVWIDPSGRWMSIASTLDEKLNIIDLETEKVVAVFDAPGLPLATSVTHDGKYALISLLLQGKVRVVDLQTMKIVKDIEVGKVPIWPAPAPDGKHILVANTGSADISVISLEKMEVIKTIPAANGVHGIIFGPKQGGGFYGYFSNKFARVMGVVDMNTLDIAGYVKLPEVSWGGNGILAIPNAYDSLIK